MRKYALYIAWLVAVVSLVVSLFTSNVYHVPVCELCWYQRICLYPLALILGVAAYYEEQGLIIKYALPLSSLAFLLALYHYLQQMVPDFEPIKLCGNGSLPSCAITHVEWFGFITYPLISMVASAAISIMLLITNKPEKEKT